MTVKPLAIAIHTSTPELGLGISNFQNLRHCQTWELGRALSNQLHPYLQEFMQPYGWQNLDFLAVAIGPGGFTGTRIGVVTARTLAQQLALPLYGISSLEAYGWQQIQSQNLSPQPGDLIAVTMAARRGMGFGGLYGYGGEQEGLTAVLGDRLMTPAQWQDVLKGRSERVHSLTVDQNLGDCVSALLSLGFFRWQRGLVESWGQVTPFYGQSPV